MTDKNIHLTPGEVILVDFPGVERTKRRPAVVVSSVRYHRARPDMIVALITSQVESAKAPTDHVLYDWRQAKLWRPSAFRSFLITLPRTSISKKVGRLSPRDWKAVVQRLRLALF